MAVATKHRDLMNIRIGEVTSGKLYGCRPDVDIHEALKVMREKQVRRLPIIRNEDGKLVGILSLNDLALMEQGGAKAELSAEDVEQTMRAICTHRTLPLANPLPHTVASAAAA
jgi:predicted transcriptional regulator